ncbi:hypothetical protein C8R44DRAFT_736923 [Mycena epipterygia]|nr:hypothetical protein C8R44DRAFT_736923 [Mycena epipterygia]
MAFTDSGPNVAEQPSKLWTTRPDFQESRARRNPTTIHPIPMTEAQRSLQTIINSARPVCKERKQNLIAAVGQKVQAAAVTLAVPSQFNMENTEHVIEMRAKVDEAALVVMSARKSLERVEDSAEKTAVISELRALETRIDFIGATLPPETTPFLFDSCLIDSPHYGEPDRAARLDGAGHDCAGRSLSRHYRPGRKSYEFHPEHRDLTHPNGHVIEYENKGRRIGGI